MRLRGHKQGKLIDHVYSFPLFVSCTVEPVDLAIKLNCNTCKVACYLNRLSSAKKPINKGEPSPAISNGVYGVTWQIIQFEFLVSVGVNQLFILTVKKSYITNSLLKTTWTR